MSHDSYVHSESKLPHYKPRLFANNYYKLKLTLDTLDTLQRIPLSGHLLGQDRVLCGMYQ